MDQRSIKVLTIPNLGLQERALQQLSKESKCFHLLFFVRAVFSDVKPAQARTP